MAKKTAVRNVESNAPKSNAVTIPDQAARLIEGLVEKTGLRRETVLRRVLEVGLETLHRNIDDPLPPNATPFRESGKSEKWSVRNHEIDIAASDFVDNAIEVFTALTPANGPWIIKELWSALREVSQENNNPASPGAVAFMLDWEFPAEVFTDKEVLRRELREVLRRDYAEGGFMSKRADTLAVHFGGRFEEFGWKRELLENAARLYRDLLNDYEGSTGEPETDQEPDSWEARNVEIEAARQTLRDRAVFTVFNLSIIDAMTPANGKWILRELKSSLESQGLLGVGTEGLLLALGYELPYGAFLSVAAFRESMADLLARETKQDGYLFQEGQTAAIALAALSSQLDEAKLLDFAARRHGIKQERNERAKAEWNAKPAA